MGTEYKPRGQSRGAGRGQRATGGRKCRHHPFQGKEKRPGPRGQLSQENKAHIKSQDAVWEATRVRTVVSFWRLLEAGQASFSFIVLKSLAEERVETSPKKQC